MNPYNEIYHLKKQVKFLQQKNLNLQEFYKAEIKRLKHEINNLLYHLKKHHLLKMK